MHFVVSTATYISVYDPYGNNLWEASQVSILSMWIFGWPITIQWKYNNFCHRTVKVSLLWIKLLNIGMFSETVVLFYVIGDFFFFIQILVVEVLYEWSKF